MSTETANAQKPEISPEEKEKNKELEIERIQIEKEYKERTEKQLKDCDFKSVDDRRYSFKYNKGFFIFRTPTQMEKVRIMSILSEITSDVKKVTISSALEIGGSGDLSLIFTAKFTTHIRVLLDKAPKDFDMETLDVNEISDIGHLILITEREFMERKKKSLYGRSVGEVFSIHWHYRENFKLTKNSPGYQNSTDDDIFLWYHSSVAKRKLDFLAMGHDSEDSNLESEDLRNKYPGGILEKKAKAFKALPIEDQSALLHNSVTGEMTAKVKRIKDAPYEKAVVVSVNHYVTELKKIKKYKDWVANSCSYAVFMKLPLEEKKKYHNVMVNFHDECIKSMKNRQPLSDERLDSSPVAQTQHKEGGCPDFDDKSKWVKD